MTHTPIDTTAPAPRPARRGWWAVLVLSLLAAAYGAMFVARGKAGFTGEFAASYRAHSLGILSHALLGTLSLIVGPLQFRRDWLARHRRLHRIGGRAYVVTALGTGLTGLYMTPFSQGGMVTHVAFGALAVLLLATTTLAFVRIRAGDVAAHRAWMVRSYALMFAGVSLRIQMPVLTTLTGAGFLPVYLWVSWLAWVPNLLWAEWYLRRRRGATHARPRAVAPPWVPRARSA